MPSVKFCPQHHAAGGRSVIFCSFVELTLIKTRKPLTAFGFKEINAGLGFPVT